MLLVDYLQLIVAVQSPSPTSRYISNLYIIFRTYISAKIGPFVLIIFFTLYYKNTRISKGSFWHLYWYQKVYCYPYEHLVLWQFEPIKKLNQQMTKSHSEHWWIQLSLSILYTLHMMKQERKTRRRRVRRANAKLFRLNCPERQQLSLRKLWISCRPLKNLLQV